MRLAPAKTNLFLEVLGRRDDGFHELDTVFAALALADELELEPLGEGRIELAVEGGGGLVPADPGNLAWRAAEALRAAAGRPELGARILLRKRIPAGGGLGGGSSDAAAVLAGLDAAWGLGLPGERLWEVAAGLGSDVPFFLQAGLQRGLGRGELLEPLPAPAAELDLVLLFPGFPCPTPEVYRGMAPYYPGVSGPAEPRELLEGLALGDPDAVAAGLWNRLELPAFARWPRLVELRDLLLEQPGVLGALLSGSGSTLFAVARTADDAARVATDLSRRGLPALATRTAMRGLTSAGFAP